MQPRVTQAGPLAAASATKIALSQTAPAAGYLALNGAAGAAIANNICLSQSGTAATALLINGALSQTAYTNPVQAFPATTIAMLVSPQLVPGKEAYRTALGSAIYITSAGNDSGITFAIVGTAIAPGGMPIVLKETVTGANTSVAASANVYQSIISITPSGNTAAAVTVGAMGFARLDIARRVILTSGGNDSALTFTISGTDWAGTPISEAVTGVSGAAASSVLDYLTVTSIKTSGSTASTITAGTNGVAGSPWINLDPWAEGTVNGQCAVTGTVNYTVQISADDPDSYGNPITRANVTWDSNAAGVVNQTTSQSFGLPYAPVWARVLLNSEAGTGSVRLTLTQHGSVPI